MQLSHVYNAPLFTLNVSLRDGKVSKSKFDWKHLKGFSDILIVDDINDSGDTLNYVMEMFHANKIFCPRTAVLLSKETSSFQTTFAGEVINKHRKDEWIVFPWE